MIHNTFDKQIAINLSLDNGIVNIDKLLACNDFETIKEGLNNYPLTINEYLKDKYKEGDSRTIFEWSVDNNAIRVSDFLINGKMPSLRFKSKNPTFDDLIDYELAELKGKGKKFINDKYFYTKNYGYGYLNSRVEPDKTKEQVVEEITKELSLKIDKETITAGLNKEYFEDLFNKGNYELLVIKLCVRLEAILKCDFHYEGTFEEMLTRFSKEHGYESVDDGWGYYSSVETLQNKVFHKLRKYRNDIVHAEKNQEILSPDEIKLAIEYVFKLD